MFAGEGANPARLTACLRRFGMEVREVGIPGLDALHPGEDVLYLPGGWYSFGPEEKEAIVAFVKAGGGCVGSCAGAYNVAGKIPVIPGRVLRNNMRGRLYVEPQRGDHPILRGVVRPCTRHKDRQWEPIAMTHLGGPFMLPDDPGTIVASYDVEGRIGAILAAGIGAGRAVALASHPEHPLADLPASDTKRNDPASLPQGDATLLVRNAVLWAAGVAVPEPGSIDLPEPVKGRSA
jgi:hypothetical protein